MTQPLPPTLGDVVVAWLHGSDCKAAFTTSLVELRHYDAVRQQRIADVIDQFSAVNVSSGRNALVRRFLDEHTASWLLMIDADMGFKPDLLDRLLSKADPESAPIVGGLCFGFDGDRPWPTLYKGGGTAEKPFFLQYVRFPLNAMFQVDATGAACLLMHRDALRTIGEKFDGAFPWFQESALGGEPLSEDLTFCLRAAKCRIPIHVNTGAPVDHHKPTVVNLEKYAAQLRAAEFPEVAS